MGRREREREFGVVLGEMGARVGGGNSGNQYACIP